MIVYDDCRIIFITLLRMPYPKHSVPCGTPAAHTSSSETLRVSLTGPEARVETSKAVFDEVDMVCTAITGPQETKASKISPMGNNRKMLGHIFFMLLSISFGVN
jgi:hypothetical protein